MKKLGRPKKSKKGRVEAIKFTISPEARKVLKKLPPGTRSEFVSKAIVNEADRSS